MEGLRLCGQGFCRVLAEDKCPRFLKKEISFLFRLQNFIPDSQGSTPPLNPLTEALSQPFPWTQELFIHHESIPARVLRHPVVPEWGGGGHFSSGCKKMLPFLSV